jgi:hypothetical protein
MHPGKAFVLGGLLDATPDGASSVDPDELNASRKREQAERRAAERRENDREAGLPRPCDYCGVLASDCVVGFSSDRRFSSDPNVNSRV